MKNSLPLKGKLVTSNHRRKGKKGGFMLHVGHFSFDEYDFDQNDRHGYFTCVVDAADEEAAVQEFRTALLDMKKADTAFSRIVNIYIEDIIQIRETPKSPIVTHMQSSEGAFPESISYSLPLTHELDVQAFGLTANVDEHENTQGDDYKISEPFINFELPNSDSGDGQASSWNLKE